MFAGIADGKDGGLRIETGRRRDRGLGPFPRQQRKPQPFGSRLSLGFSCFLLTVSSAFAQTGEITPSVPPAPPAAVERVDAAGMVARLTSSGFRCFRAPPNGSAECRGMVEGYPKQVRVFVPPAFSLAATPSPTLLIHFHGWLQGTLPQEGVFDRHRFGDRLALTGVNAVLVVPESADRCATYREQLRTGPQWAGFLSRLEALGKGSGPGVLFGSLVLSGHSGAYQIFANLALALQTEDRVLRKIHAAGLFDAVYGREDELTELAKLLAGRKDVFYSSYLAYGAGATGMPSDGNQTIMNKLKAASVSFQLLPGAHLPPLEPRTRIFFRPTPIMAGPPDPHFKMVDTELSLFWKSVARGP